MSIIVSSVDLRDEAAQLAGEVDIPGGALAMTAVTRVTSQLWL